VRLDLTLPDQAFPMPNVVRRLFRRHTEPKQGLRTLGDPGEPSLTLWPKLVEPRSDPKLVKRTRDEEAIEQQITALMSAWDKTSLCARRKFLTRVDQRIMTLIL
jgi:hypothetical protein